MSQQMATARLNAAAQLAEDNDKRSYWAYKRCFDVVVASIMLVVLAPLMIAIAILIKLDSPGPALFVQQRVGARRRVENGQVRWEVVTFPFYKFRSMRVGSDNDVSREMSYASLIKGTWRAESGSNSQVSPPSGITTLPGFRIPDLNHDKIMDGTRRRQSTTGNPRDGRRTAPDPAWVTPETMEKAHWWVPRRPPSSIFSGNSFPVAPCSLRCIPFPFARAPNAAASKTTRTSTHPYHFFLKGSCYADI